LLNLINKFDSYYQLEQHIVVCTRDSRTRRKICIDVIRKPEQSTNARQKVQNGGHNERGRGKVRKCALIIYAGNMAIESARLLH